MRWLVAAEDGERAGQLAGALGVHPLVGRVLLGRGLGTAALAQDFLKDRLADLPDPFTMKGMDGAVGRLRAAILAKDVITLYGDYDVDGVCSTALLSLFLEDCGAQVRTYIPHRMDEGYGLNLAAVERIAQDGTRVLVTLDCGITSVTEVARARALGLDVVVVDHHTVPAVLPDANAILNPHQPGCGYTTRHLCAAGVAFNLCMGLRKALRESGGFGGRPEPVLRSYLDLVALATVADVVPLTGANRVLVKHGLAELSRAGRLGVRALKEVAGMPASATVGAGQVGFRLGPRINAAGRLDDASVGLQLLRCQDPVKARALAAELESANAERQGIEQDILAGALAQAEAKQGSRGLVLYSDDWHAGVIGIVASRVVERFYRPTVMVAVKDGVGKGSGRSIEAFHLHDALAACQSHLVKFGGHKHAAGITISAENLPAFEAAFAQHADRMLTDEDLIPRCKVDAVVTTAEVTEAAVSALEMLAPFGSGNPEPVLALRRQSARPRVLPPKNGKGVGHLKLALEAAAHLPVIGFNLGDKAALAEGPLDLAFHAGFDTWNGEKRLQLKLKDLRVSS